MDDASRTATDKPVEAATLHKLPATGWIIAFCSLPLVAFVVLLLAIPWLGNPSERGQLGDTIGGLLNPLIAWLTLVALAFTARYTVESIRLSARGLNEAREQFQTEREHAEQGGREERTFQMYQAWIAPEMLNARAEALHCLLDFAQAKLASWQQNPSAVREIFIGDLQGGSYYKSIVAVVEFFADLNSMLDTGILDEDLAWTLFESKAEEWVEPVGWIDFMTESGKYRAHSNWRNDWMDSHVKPLFAKLQARRDGRTADSHQGAKT